MQHAIVDGLTSIWGHAMCIIVSDLAEEIAQCKADDFAIVHI